VVEFAILAGPMLIITFLIAQVGLIFHGRSTALAAATAGANAERRFESEPGSGLAAARLFLDRTSGALITSDVTVPPPEDDIVTVTVTGEVYPVLPIRMLRFTVTEVARRPVERWVP
jgi:Flp pilus assembly protein TadG